MNAATTTTAWWPSVITWGLVLAGWFAVHLATLARERRKERREVVKVAIDALRQLELEALQFHSAPKFDSVTANNLIYKTGRIIRSLQRPPLNALDIPLSRMVKVRKAVTLNNADPSSFQPQQVNSQLLTDLRAAIDDLADAIEAARDNRWA